MTRHAETTKVRPGQVWADNDRRCKGRTVRVDSTDGRFAYCTVLTDRGGEKPLRARTVRIAIERMRPTSTGYRLVPDVPEVSA